MRATIAPTLEDPEILRIAVYSARTYPRGRAVGWTLLSAYVIDKTPRVVRRQMLAECLRSCRTVYQWVINHEC